MVRRGGEQPPEESRSERRMWLEGGGESSHLKSQGVRGECG